MAKNPKAEGRVPGKAAAPLSSARGSADRTTLATLAGVVVLLIISFSNWREIDRIQSSLDRLNSIENRLVEVAAKVDNPAPARADAAPSRRRPDPNRVYGIKTAGAPYKGPAVAPITIAEFSDFQ